MGVSKTFTGSVSKNVGGYGTYKLYLSFDMSETYNINTNKSDIAFSNFQIKAELPNGNNTSFVGGTIKVTANSTDYTIFSADASKGTYKVAVNGSYNIVLVNSSSVAWSYTLSGLTHDSTGALSITVSWDSITLNNYFAGFNISITGSDTVALTTATKYVLTLTAGAGTNLYVTVSSSPFRSTGTSLSNSSSIYAGEQLKVTYDIITGYTNSTCTVSGIGTVNTGGTFTVSSNHTVTTSASVLSYTLSTSPDTGSIITVNRIASPLKGASTGVLASGATIYYNDVLLIEFGVSIGYKLITKTVNGSDFTSGDSHTVTANVTIITISEVSGVVHIDNGTTIDMYLVYIDNGSGWDQYIPYLDNGTSWNLFS